MKTKLKTSQDTSTSSPSPVHVERLTFRVVTRKMTKLEEMAAKARAEHRAGKTTPFPQ